MIRHPATVPSPRPGPDLDRLLGGGSTLGLGDGALLDRVAAGAGPAAGGAFEALHQRHGPMVARVCRGILGDSQLAEDAAQAVFLVLLRRARSIGDPTRLAPWLHGVALRTARAARRAHRRHALNPISPEDPTMTSTAPDPTQSALARERAEILHAAIARLPHRYRGAVILCDLEGLTHAEAAQRLDCPTATVSIRLKRARERLRAALARHRLDFESALPPVALGAAPRALAATAAARLLARHVLGAAALTQIKAITAAALVAGLAAVGTVAAPPARQDPPTPMAGVPATGGPVALQDPLAATPGSKAALAPAPVEVAPGVMVGLPIVRDVTDYEQFIGHVAASRTVEVRAQVNGFTVESPVAEGDQVEEGQVLFKLGGLENVKLEGQSNTLRKQIADAKSLLGKIRSDSRGQGGLAEDRARKNLSALNEQLEQFEAGRIWVLAPFAGQVARRMVDVGATVEAGKTPLATIAVVDPILVDFEMDEGNFLKIRRWLMTKPGTAHLPVRVQLTGEEGFPHEGRVLVQTGRFNPETGTCTLHAALPNPDQALIPGLSAQVRVETGEPHRAILVPEGAIETERGQKFLRVVDAAGIVQRRPIKVGMLIDDRREVREGIDAETRIILDARATIPVGTKVTLPGDAPPR